MDRRAFLKSFAGAGTLAAAGERPFFWGQQGSLRPRFVGTTLIRPAEPARPSDPKYRNLR